jgi:hypothetical protein
MINTLSITMTRQWLFLYDTVVLRYTIFRSENQLIFTLHKKLLYFEFLLDITLNNVLVPMLILPQWRLKT